MRKSRETDNFALLQQFNKILISDIEGDYLMVELIPQLKPAQYYEKMAWLIS